jgi:hypothetical protein
MEQIKFNYLREDKAIIGRVNGDIFIKIDSFNPKQWYTCDDTGLRMVLDFELHKELDRAYDKYYAPKRL